MLDRLNYVNFTCEAGSVGGCVVVGRALGSAYAIDIIIVGDVGRGGTGGNAGFVSIEGERRRWTGGDACVGYGIAVVLSGR